MLPVFHCTRASSFNDNVSKRSAESAPSDISFLEVPLGRSFLERGSRRLQNMVGLVHSLCHVPLPLLTEPVDTVSDHADEHSEDAKYHRAGDDTDDKEKLVLFALLLHSDPCTRDRLDVVYARVCPLGDRTLAQTSWSVCAGLWRRPLILALRSAALVVHDRCATALLVCDRRERQHVLQHVDVVVLDGDGILDADVIALD